MTLELSTSDKRLLLRSRKGNERDILNDGQANFILAMLSRQFRDVGGFASLTYKNKGLYWEEEEKLQRCIFKFRISGSENIKQHFKYIGREGSDIAPHSDREDLSRHRVPVGFFNATDTDLANKDIKFYTDAHAEQILLRQTHTSSIVRKGIKAAKKAGEGKPLNEVSGCLHGCASR